MTVSAHPATLSIQATPVLDYLENDLPGYPFETETDRAFVDELLDDFPTLDLLEQIKRYRWFHDNQPQEKRARLALRRWLAGARRWR